MSGSGREENRWGEFHALLVEGVPGIAKSTALIRRHIDSSNPRRIRSCLPLSQSHTYGPLAPAENRSSLTIEANLHSLDRIAQTLEWLHADLQHCDKSCFVIIDSLHLTHCRRPGILAGMQRRLISASPKLAASCCC